MSEQETKEMPTGPREGVVSEDEALDKILGEETKPDADEEQPEAKAEGDDESTEGGEPESEKDEAEPDEEEPAEDERAVKREALEKAINTLRQRKVPQTVLKKMSNAEILDMAGTEQTFITSMANTQRELAELRKQAESKSSKVEHAPLSGVPASEPLDFSSSVEPLNELVGPEIAAGLSEVLGKAGGGILSTVSAEFAKRDAATKQVGDLLRETLFELGRQQLLERFPQLSKQDVFDELKKTAVERLNLGAFEDPRGVLEFAARAKFFGSTGKAAAKDARDLGQVSKARGPSKSKPLSAEEKEDKALDIILKGGSQDDVRAAIGDAR